MCAAAAAGAAAGAAGGITSPEFAVIVPTYNERENVPILAWLVKEAFEGMGLPAGAGSGNAAGAAAPGGWPTYEIVFVDDNSPDGTAAAIYDLMAAPAFKNVIKLVERPAKLGLGTAYVAGLQATRAPFIILMDADLSHHPLYIPHMIAKQRSGDFDVVSGSRYRSGGGVAGWDLRRVVMSRGAALVATLALGSAAAGVSDLTGSFRLYRRNALETVVACMRPSGYVFQMEIIVRAKALGYSIAEVPIVFVDRLYGKSKLGSNEVVAYLKGVLRLMFAL